MLTNPTDSASCISEYVRTVKKERLTKTNNMAMIGIARNIARPRFLQVKNMRLRLSKLHFAKNSAVE